MGIWPQFHKCCWVLPLNIGTIVIGYYTAVANGVVTVLYIIGIVMNIQRDLDNNYNPGYFDYFADTISLLISIFGTILGLIIIIGWKKARYLKKAVFGMTTLSLLHLLAAILNVSHVDAYIVYLRAVNMLMSAYFILIIRSAQLQLEGCLDESSPMRRVHRQRLSDHELVHREQPFPRPPAYDEAVRCRNIYRCELNLTLPPMDEEAIEVATTNDTGIAVLPVEQATINPGIPKDEKDAPMIFDVEQFNALRNMQVVERNEASTSSVHS